MDTCEGVVKRLRSGVWSYGIFLPEDIAQKYLAGNKRVRCTVGGKHTFQAALLSAGGGQHYILANKALRTALGLDEGSTVAVELQADNSEYGMEMCEELRECLELDPEAAALFESLTPGKKRTLIYWVANVKSSNKRIQRSVVLLRYLVESGGAFSFAVLNRRLSASNNPSY